MRLWLQDVKVLVAESGVGRIVSGQYAKKPVLRAQIHRQLPLSLRELDKLNRTLQASFRKQLDETHPVGLLKRGTPTDDHLRPILSSPLFVPVEMGECARTDADQRGHLTAMEKFKLTVGTGTADLQMARTSLSNELRRLRNLADKKGVDLSGLMKTSAAGSLVRSWLWSSGQEVSLDFLMSEHFARVLIAFLVAEGQVAIPLQWLKFLSSRPRRASRESTVANLHEDRILYKLVSAHRLVGQGIGAALQVFLDYLGFKKSHASSTEKDNFSSCRLAGSSLVRALAKVRRPIIPDIAVYDSFQQSVDLWARQTWWAHKFKASLLLYHPVKADESLVWLYLQRLASHDMGGLATDERRDTIKLLLDATEMFLSKGSYVRAAWLATFMQTYFGAELGIEEAIPEQIATMEEDMSLIKSLEALVPD